ncbi:4E-binding protein thor, putative [Pediculus humanus corporis]|uniref:4E-binding protein thor, putative n=1 Tax=Pediculus humanus subsp. corporis TaxID=121224 RepID=E0VKT4_PEDHC|nr:4E-binding protein thor, putative [Pediculus humanus corporis]EEB13990.1 4E-binding protein thor, putative [Pediculus humanus corporis]
MSASPVARQTTNCQNIPSRRVVVNDASQLPHDYSTTPGGTLFSTTPGGSLNSKF